ncbi:MAG: patatin-like phospholipase family protein [Candidatus Omnitrophica bacterium]|nr:patatin-like phospholipase family protein [Candidatus Omnitrophota bacterium]MCF7894260.1 patatin-like phospholipase family protein [Candidatus Omnitrophota bacterium]
MNQNKYGSRQLRIVVLQSKTSGSVLCLKIMAKKKKIGLVLGGGGARGLAHIGVIRQLEKAGIVPDIIVGASMGAVIGGAYALFANAKILEKKVLELVKNKDLSKLESLAAPRSEEDKEIIFQRLATFVSKLVLWNLRAVKGSITDGIKIKEIINKLINSKKFSQTKIKFACTAIDINWGKEVLFTKGFLADAIFASISIPGVFPPIKQDGKLLVDGGIINMVPVEVAQRLGADITIAIDASLDIKPTEFKHGHDILFRTEMIKEKEIGELKMKSADIIIRPDVGGYSWARFSKINSLIKKGEVAANDKLAEIKKVIEGKNSLLNKITGKLRGKKK